VYRLAELLGEQRAATRDNVQRKQARTDGEREESDDEHISDNDSDDDENDIPYNPKNLPLGWDGKVRSGTHLDHKIQFCNTSCHFLMLLKFSCHSQMSALLCCNNLKIAEK